MLEGHAIGALNLQRQAAAIGQSRLWNWIAEEMGHEVFPSIMNAYPMSDCLTTTD